MSSRDHDLQVTLIDHSLGMGPIRKLHTPITNISHIYVYSCSLPFKSLLTFFSLGLNQSSLQAITSPKQVFIMDWYSDPTATAVPDWSKQDLKHVFSYSSPLQLEYRSHPEVKTNLDNSKPHSPPSWHCGRLWPHLHPAPPEP
jgi:hypothetical protein